MVRKPGSGAYLKIWNQLVPTGTDSLHYCIVLKLYFYIYDSNAVGEYREDHYVRLTLKGFVKSGGWFMGSLL